MFKKSSKSDKNFKQQFLASQQKVFGKFIFLSCSHWASICLEKSEQQIFKKETAPNIIQNFEL